MTSDRIETTQTDLKIDTVTRKSVNFKDSIKSIQIIAPIEECQSFDTTLEFEEYYNKHKEELDKLTTHKLNKLFYINDHKITKIKGILQLKRESNNTITNRVRELELKLDRVITKINAIIEIIQSDSNLHQYQ